MIDLKGEEFLKGLRQLHLVSKHDFSGQRVGERRTKKKGSSVEFMDYKEYDPGDDIRFIDWNLWGRLDKFYIKLFHSEENLNVFFLFDTSRSMRFGNPSKWDFMLQFVAATSWLSLNQKDQVWLYPFGETLVTRTPNGSSPGHYPGLVHYLEELAPTNQGNLTKAVDDFLGWEKRKGILFFVSDWFYPREEVEYALKKLAWFRYDVTVVHTLAKEEIAPPMQGFFQLVDSETGKDVELDVNSEYLNLYNEVLEEHRRTVEGAARRFGFQYAFSASDESFKDLIIRLLLR